LIVTGIAFSVVRTMRALVTLYGTMTAPHEENRRLPF
jgi:hypothetical protein